MSKTSKILITLVLLVVLLIGIGYAAIQNITLNIAGTAEADPSQSNFKVMFSGEPTVSDEEFVTAAITDDINATISVEGLTKKGETVSATYTVQNVSTDISADLAVSTTNDNPEYFKLSSRLGKTSLVPGEATTLTVEVELSKVLIKESEYATIGVQLVAMPVEPGQEGTSEGIKGTSQTPESTLALVTNNNIGDYIDLGNNIIGTENTTDDWRILYNDEEKVYAILADYLPASQVPTSTGLRTAPDDSFYNVWYSPLDTFLNILLDTSVWNDFANGINGATAIGTPTKELIINSSNTKGMIEEQTEYGGVLFSKTSKDYDLYFPREESIGDCVGCFIATKADDESIYTMSVGIYASMVMTNCFDEPHYTIRPVVALPISTNVEVVNGIWTVE